MSCPKEGCTVLRRVVPCQCGGVKTPQAKVCWECVVSQRAKRAVDLVCPGCGGSKNRRSHLCRECKWAAQRVTKEVDLVCSGCGGSKGKRAHLCRSCNNAETAAGRKLDKKWLECPDCGGPKSASSARCKKCYWSTRKCGAESPTRRYNLMYKYGITVEQFDEMSAVQGGACLTCFKVPDVGLVVDHCHVIGHFRGLLCNDCNTALGLAHDDPVVLRRLADYVEAASVAVS